MKTYPLMSKTFKNLFRRLKIATQKKRKIRCLIFNSLDRVLGLLHGRLYFASSDKVVLGYQPYKNEKKKERVMKNRCEIFRDNNHQSL